MDNLESFTTNQGKQGLLCENFKYRLDRQTKSTKLWRCVKRSCKARCKTDLQNVPLFFSNEHSHEEESTRSLETHKLRQGCKRRAADDTFERPSKIINMELQAGSADIQEILPRDVLIF
ncbi:hypothetical protein ACOMHN_058904 [Nucella lapillus]